MEIITRKCGKCSVCCTVLAIDDLNKSAGVRCKHVGTRGCSIYKDRPHACHSFTCEWLRRSELPRELRPDKCGVMLSGTTNGQGLAAYEIKKGAVTKSAFMVAFLMEAAESGVPVAVLHPNGDITSLSGHSFNNENLLKPKQE